jgi:glucosamine-6-phosphate deaminase
LDEYIGLKKEHPQSYYYFMQEELFKHINVPANKINVPNGDFNPEKEVLWS